MNARPPDGSDEPEAVDQVMLAVLSNRGRDATSCGGEQDAGDDWVGGRLAPTTRSARRRSAAKTLAAERVLERDAGAAARVRPSRSTHGANHQGERARRKRQRCWLVAIARPLAVGRIAGASRLRRSWWSPACRSCSR